MFYDRKIKYVNVYENGEKGQSAGFVKMEARNDMVSLQVQVAGLHHTDTYNCSVVLMSGEKEFVIGELQLERGKGIKEFYKLGLTNMGGQIGYKELEEIQIRMAGNRLLRCIVREPVKKSEMPAVEETVMEEKDEVFGNGEFKVVDEVTGKEEAEIDEVRVGKADVEVDDTVTEKTNVEVEEAVAGKTNVEVEEAVAEKTNVEMDRTVDGKSEAELLKEAFLAEKRMRESEEINVMEQEAKQSVQKLTQPQNVRAPQPVDKWQQLQAVYPHIRPFEDRREYLMMKPQDFVILPQKYFTLADNSFLLHGYYNYDHLILSKEKRPEGEQMYIGVPGNFYDKEKQVAIMFGFESFEGKREPARTGDFGYYMIPVEI